MKDLILQTHHLRKSNYNIVKSIVDAHMETVSVKKGGEEDPLTVNEN